MFVLGDVPVGATLYLPFDTYSSAGASVTITGLAVTDIEIYKNGSTTQRASDNGYTLLDTDGIDFDGVTGLHGFSVDLADNSDASFYAAGSEYWTNVNAITVDGQTVRFTYYFTIGRLLRPATAGRTLVVDSAGLADANAVKLGPSGSGTAQTARDLGASVLLASGTGTGQLDFTSGVVKANVTHYGGSAGTFTGGRPEVKLGDIAHGGTSAVLTLERLIAESTTAGQPGAKFVGNTSGHGVRCVGGASGGSGLWVASGGSGGYGFEARGDVAGIRGVATGTDGHGMILEPDGSGNALDLAGPTNAEVHLVDDAVSSSKFAVNAITAAAIAAGAIEEDTFAADTAKYQAKVWLIDDDAGTTDRWVVAWFKNGAPVLASITSPTFQLIKASDGSDHIASTAMTEIGTTELYKYDATSGARIAAGAGYVAKVQATIDGSTRTWVQPVGRDST